MRVFSYFRVLNASLAKPQCTELPYYAALPKDNNEEAHMIQS